VQRPCHRWIEVQLYIARGADAVDGSSGDPSVRGVRAFFDALAAEPRVRATAVQKGYDGFAVRWSVRVAP
jgi:hypothetical protein